MDISPTSFSVTIGKDHLRFSAAHFIAYPGFREPLNGHTYQVEVTVSGELGHEGYVIDFLTLQAMAQKECATLDCRVLIPCKSDCLEIVENSIEVFVHCEDGSRFVFPRPDVCLLPLVHTSSEEIANYLLSELGRKLLELGRDNLRSIEVIVEDSPGHIAVCQQNFLPFSAQFQSRGAMSNHQPDFSRRQASS